MPAQTVSRTGNQASTGPWLPPVSSAEQMRISREGTLWADSQEGTGGPRAESGEKMESQPAATGNDDSLSVCPHAGHGGHLRLHESRIQKLGQPSRWTASPFPLKEGSPLTSEQRKEEFSFDHQILDDATEVKCRLVFPKSRFSSTIDSGLGEHSGHRPPDISERAHLREKAGPQGRRPLQHLVPLLPNTHSPSHPSFPKPRAEPHHHHQNNQHGI